MASPQDIAQALKYGPQTAGLMRRSAYLEDALKAMAESGGQNIRSPLELGAKLLAQAVMKRASDKAQNKTLEAIRADREMETRSLLAPFERSPPPQPAFPPMAPPQPPQQPPQAQNQPQPQQSPQQAPPQLAQAPMVPPPAPMQQSQVQPAAFNIGDPEIDAIVRTVYGEARGEGPQGQAAVAGVILNRARERGMKPSEVVFQPGQFEPWGNPETRARLQSLDPNSPEYQAVLQNILPALQGQNPVGGADHFYSPGAQSALGRPPPKWDNGSGQDLGRHRFFDLEQGDGPAPQFQFASMQTPAMEPMSAPQVQPPSAPESSPPGAGGPPAAQLPQVQAAGGNPSQQWPTYQPTQPEIDFVRGLLSDPRTFEQGKAEAMKLRQKMSQPAPAKIIEMNGLQFYVPETPGQGGPPVKIPVPREAMTRNAPAEQFGVAAPRGTIMAADPYNNLKTVVSPQPGQQVASNPGEPYRETFTPGGTNDPFRPQTPAQGYQYQGGAQRPIPGGPADPSSGANLVAGEGKLRDDYEKQIKDYSAAREGYQKVIQAAGMNSNAGDIALVFGFMKTLDPGSTVREGEQATVQNSGTIDQTVQNIYNSLITGKGRLSPEQRGQFSETARRQFDVYQRTADDLTKRYSELAKSYGYNPDRIVRSFDPIEPYKPPPSIPQAASNRYNSMKIDPSKPWGHKDRPFLARDAATLQNLDRPENRGKFVITPDGALAVID